MTYMLSDEERNQPFVTMALLHGRFPVSAAVFTRIRDKISTVCTQLDPTLTYGPKQLCGADFWDQLGIKEARLAGSCVSHLALSGQVPLVKVSLPGRPSKYALVGGLLQPSNA